MPLCRCCTYTKNYGMPFFTCYIFISNSSDSQRYAYAFLVDPTERPRDALCIRNGRPFVMRSPQRFQQPGWKCRRMSAGKCDIIGASSKMASANKLSARVRGSLWTNAEQTTLNFGSYFPILLNSRGTSRLNFVDVGVFIQKYIYSYVFLYTFIYVCVHVCNYDNFRLLRQILCYYTDLLPLDGCHQQRPNHAQHHHAVIIQPIYRYKLLIKPCLSLATTISQKLLRLIRAITNIVKDTGLPLTK